MTRKAPGTNSRESCPSGPGIFTDIWHNSRPDGLFWWRPRREVLAETPRAPAQHLRVALPRPVGMASASALSNAFQTTVNFFCDRLNLLRAFRPLLRRVLAGRPETPSAPGPPFSRHGVRATLVEKAPLEPSTPELRLFTGQVCLRRVSPDRTIGSGAAQYWGCQGLRKLSQPSAPLGLIEP